MDLVAPGESERLIGYYVHHQGSGHLHRATAVAEAASGALVGLSTLGRPKAWAGEWVDLPHDVDEASRSFTAGNRLHYVPLGSDGLRRRMVLISSWIATAVPAVVVVDVSVEVALLARLHGIAVAVMAQPGRRTDPAHQLAYDIADRVIAPWPAEVGNIWGGTPAALEKTVFVGAVSRYAPAARAEVVEGRVVLINGTGGGGHGADQVRTAQSATPGRHWIHLDRGSGSWVSDPWPLLRSAEVVIASAGQNVVAEIAAARRPAILLPQARPFEEQAVMAEALKRAALPVIICETWPDPGEWPGLLAAASQLDGTAWARWNDGLGASRISSLLTGTDRLAGVAV